MSVELIAEVGSNHNGDYATALKLIQAAKSAGADTVKFQHYPADGRYGPVPMPKQWLRPLQDACHEVELDFLCSVFDYGTLLDYVQECEPQRVKVASPELTDNRLLDVCANHVPHLILSTGMSTNGQIVEALDTVYTANLQAKVTLLHCVSSYPAPPEEMNLRAMSRLGEFGEYGLSDHTLDPALAPVMATTLGASIIEKHFTLSRGEQGPDHSYAVDPRGFAEMFRAVRLVESMLGDGRKRVMPSEDPTDRRTEEWRAA